MPESATHGPPGRPPVLTALAAQAAAAVLCIGAAALVRQSGLAAPTWPIILACQGGLAAALGLRWGLPRWWLPLNLAAPLAMAAGLALNPPTWVFPVILGLMVLVFWNSAGDRVPLYLSNRTTWEALGELLPPEPGGQFIDLGAGLGGALTALARRRPDMEFLGVETAPIPFAIGWLRLRLAGLKNAKIRFGNLWDTDLSKARVVYAFLSPAPMGSLFRKVRAELPAGSIFISNSFEAPGAAPQETRELPDRRRTRLLIWRF